MQIISSSILIFLIFLVSLAIITCNSFNLQLESINIIELSINYKQTQFKFLILSFLLIDSSYCNTPWSPSYESFISCIILAILASIITTIFILIILILIYDLGVFFWYLNRHMENQVKLCFQCHQQMRTFFWFIFRKVIRGIQEVSIVINHRGVI